MTPPPDALAPEALAPDAPAEPAPRPARPGSFLRVFPSIMLPMFLAIADQTIVAAALPAIAGELGDAERVSWVVVSYLVANTVVAPVYGRLGDAFGRRRMMLLALAMFTIGCVLCALATSTLALIAFRVVQGLGGGGLMTTSQALIGEAVPSRERGRYQGYLATVAVTSSMLGPVLGPVLGGVLAGQFGWRAIFLVNLPLALLAAVLALRLPARPGGAARGGFRFDGVGLALFSAVVVLTLVGLGQLPHLGPRSAWWVAAGLVAWAAAVALLVRYESRVPMPLIPVRLLARPAIWRADGLAACHGAALGVGSMACGRIISASGRMSLIPALGLSVSTLCLVAAAFAAPALGTAGFVALLGVASLFMGSVMAVVQVTVQSVAGPEMLGSAAASVQFSRSLGAAVGTALVGIVLFGSLAGSDADAARLFVGIVERGPDAALAGLDAARREALRGEIAEAFRAAFLTIAAFTTIGVGLAATSPFRRIG